MRSLILAMVLSLMAGTASAIEMQRAPAPPQSPVLRALPQDPQLSEVPRPRPPLQFDFVPGKNMHSEDQMAPWDPSDQQQNQSHGLAPLPGDDVGRYYWREP